MNRHQLFSRMQHSQHRRGFLTPTIGLILLVVILAIMDILVITRFLPAYDQTAGMSRVISDVLFPANYIGNLLNLTASNFNSILVFVIQFFYLYLLACILRMIFRPRHRFERLMH